MLSATYTTLSWPDFITIFYARRQSMDRSDECTLAHVGTGRDTALWDRTGRDGSVQDRSVRHMSIQDRSWTIHRTNSLLVVVGYYRTGRDGATGRDGTNRDKTGREGGIPPHQLIISCGAVMDQMGHGSAIPNNTGATSTPSSNPPH